jgi:hypothetical protein
MRRSNKNGPGDAVAAVIVIVVAAVVFWLAPPSVQAQPSCSSSTQL